MGCSISVIFEWTEDPKDQFLLYKAKYVLKRTYPEFFGGSYVPWHISDMKNNTEILARDIIRGGKQAETRPIRSKDKSCHIYSC